MTRYGDGAARWSEDIWPRICRSVCCALEATASRVQHRPRTVEFLGFDVILDDTLTPWLLEANMSPAMAHRGGPHDEMIASMAEGLVDLAIAPLGLSKECSRSMDDTSSSCGTRSGDAAGKWEPLFPSLVDMYTGDEVAARRRESVGSGQEAVEDERVVGASLLSARAGVGPAGPPSSGRRAGAAGSRGEGSSTRSSPPVRPSSAPAAGNLHAAVTLASLQVTESCPQLWVSGYAVTNEQMDFADCCCTAFGAVLRLQRYYLLRRCPVPYALPLSNTMYIEPSSQTTTEMCIFISK